MLHHHSREFAHTISGPLCPMCQIPDVLLGVESGFAGPDLWTFECLQCELDYKALAEDPMRSRRWAGSKRTTAGRVSCDTVGDTPARQGEGVIRHSNILTRNKSL